MIYSKAADLAYRRAIWLPCQTVVVTFHEAVWVVAGTAAPVIALAVVVSLGDTVREFIAFMSEFLRVPSRVTTRTGSSSGDSTSTFGLAGSACSTCSCRPRF